MSDQPARRDRGFTLPELLVTLTIMGLIATVLASTVIVTMRQDDNTQGRLNVARAEQSIGAWVPTDLASAAFVVTDPGAVPCGADCPPDTHLGGSNAMLLTWTTTKVVSGTTVDVETTVSYRYVQLNGEWVLLRVECISSGGAPSCNEIVVLHDLAAPPDGYFDEGVTSPNWVIIVSEPLGVCATTDGDGDADGDGQLDDCDADNQYVKDANRVVVTINGGGDTEGRGGGINQISITAGGTKRETIAADSVVGTPSFAAAKTRCGGPIAVVVDNSNSIDDVSSQDPNRIRDAVYDFVETFAGTPTEIMVVPFASMSHVVDGGAGTTWNKYYDMREPDQVVELLASLPYSAFQPGAWDSGGTNWEDALYRVFYNETGAVQSKLPDTVVFFTDGVPTRDRLDGTGYNAQNAAVPAEPAALPPGFRIAGGAEYDQEAYYRAEYIAGQWRGQTKFIGVGVGGAATGQSRWVDGVARGYHLVFERGYHRYKRYWEWQTTIVRQGRRWRTVTVKATGNDVNVVNPDNFDWVPESVYFDGTSGGDTHGYADTGSNIYSDPYLDWEATTLSGSGPGWRSSKVYGGTPPYDGIDNEASGTTMRDNADILALLVSGSPNGFVYDPALDNAEEADMFLDASFDELPNMLSQIALAECGGTLTIQTRHADTNASIADPFVYEASQVRESDGPLDVPIETVTTSQRFTTGTFDFPIADGGAVEVDIRPQNLSELSTYTIVGWECRAGLEHRAADPLDPSRPLEGISVEVAANEAVSCTLKVRI